MTDRNEIEALALEFVSEAGKADREQDHSAKLAWTKAAAKVQALARRLSPPAARVPEGWQLVPRELTKEMFYARDRAPFVWGDTFATVQLQWREMLSAAPQPEAVKAEPVAHWSIAAAEGLRPYIDMMLPSQATTGPSHLLWMLCRMRDGMSATKACRWLGWIQCAIVASGAATLEEMKAHNLRHSENSAHPAPPPADHSPGAGNVVPDAVKAGGEAPEPAEAGHKNWMNGCPQPCDVPNGEGPCCCGAWHDKPDAGQREGVDSEIASLIQDATGCSDSDSVYAAMAVIRRLASAPQPTQRGEEGASAKQRDPHQVWPEFDRVVIDAWKDGGDGLGLDLIACRKSMLAQPEDSP